MAGKVQFGSLHKRSSTAGKHRLIILSGAALLAVIVIIGTVVIPPSDSVDASARNRISADLTDQHLGYIRLLVPTSPVTKGTKLSQVEFQHRSWPRTDVPEGAIRNLDAIGGMFAKVDLPKGQPMVMGNLSTTPVIPGLQELIPPNHRAVTIEVDATEGVEGYATPGAHVDVLLTFQDTSENRTVTRVAVEDAVVLSFNGRTRTVDTTEAGSRISRRSTVTLAVAQEDALKIQTARSLGRLTLALRSISDTVRSPVNKIDDSVFKEDKRPAARKTASRNAVARFRDSDGIFRDYVLGDDGKWYALDEEG